MHFPIGIATPTVSATRSADQAFDEDFDSDKNSFFENHSTDQNSVYN